LEPLSLHLLQEDNSQKAQKSVLGQNLFIAQSAGLGPPQINTPQLLKRAIQQPMPVHAKRPCTQFSIYVDATPTQLAITTHDKSQTLIAHRESSQMSNELMALTWAILIAPSHSHEWSDSKSAIARIKCPNTAEHPTFGLIPRILRTANIHTSGLY